jgi:predicted permease
MGVRMSGLRTFWSRFVALFRRRALDRELDEELRSHLAMAAEENQGRGMATEEARLRALRDFGGVTQVRERVRMREGILWAEQLRRDVEYGLRQLRRSPGFAVTAILTLAVGLGANTAVFSLINGLLLRPLPVPQGEELSVLHMTGMDFPGDIYSFSEPLFRQLEERHDVFRDVAASAGRELQVRSAAGNVRVQGAIVSGEFFDALETPPLLGRWLTRQDDPVRGTAQGSGVVIGEDFWRTWFHGVPDVVGKPITIANTPFTVVGVMPRRFIGSDPTERPQIYVPLAAEPVIDAPYKSVGKYQSWWLRAMVRRKPGVSNEQANAWLTAATGSLLDEAARVNAEWAKKAAATHLRLFAEEGSRGFTYLRAIFRKPLVAVFLLCGAMLLLACLNLASLLMARAAARERELATRLALGANRGRLIRQLLVESLLTAVLGTCAGLIAAPLVSHALAAMILGRSSTFVLDTSFDARVFAFVAASVALSTLLVGLIPAVRATSHTLSEQIKSGSHAHTAQRRKRLTPALLMGAEVALALVLVVGAGLLATSLTRLYRIGLGFEPRGLVNLSIDMGKQPRDGQALMDWYREYAEAASQLPGVRSVSIAAKTPMDGSMWTSTLRTPWSGGDREMYEDRVSPEFFATMYIPLSAGRDFRWNDTTASGLKLILSRTAADYLFPGRPAVGQTVVEDKKSYEVIAVVGDIRYATLQEGTRAEAYLPITQDEDKKPSYTAVMRAAGEPGAAGVVARSLAMKMAPEIPAPELTTMSQDLEASIASERMMAFLAVFFAGCALLVTGIGLYGTLAYGTARRTSEIGIRIALGAQRARVLRLIFLENAWIVAAGSLVGLAVALGASRALGSLLYGTSARDPWVLVGSAVVLAVIASAASLLPAARAARIEPMAALREQ